MNKNNKYVKITIFDTDGEIVFNRVESIKEVIDITRPYMEQDIEFTVKPLSDEEYNETEK